MLVTAYDKRTGKKHPNPVPQRWLDKGVVAPYLTASQSTATAAANKAAGPENTVEGTTTATGQQRQATTKKESR